MRILKSIVCGSATALFLCAHPGLADVSSELFDFRKVIAAKASHGVPGSPYEIICVMELDNDVVRHQSLLTFLGEKGRGGELLTMSGFSIKDLGADLWTGGPALDEDPSTPPTPDWGWIYDRNNDGQIDWLAFLDGPLIVLPKEGFQEGFPTLSHSGARRQITARQLGIMQNNAQLVYRHIIDSDFDGVADAFMLKPTSDENGWWEGEMLVAEGLGPDGKSECLWQSDYDPSDVLRCEFEGGGYRTVEGEPKRSGYGFAKGFFFDLFDLIVSKGQQCDFGRLGIATRP